MADNQPDQGGPLFAMLRDVREDLKDLKSEFKENREKIDQVLERVTRLESTLASQNSTVANMQAQITDQATRISRLERTTVSVEEIQHIRENIVALTQQGPPGGCKVFHEMVTSRMATDAAARAIAEKTSNRMLHIIQIIGPYLAMLISLAALVWTITTHTSLTEPSPTSSHKVFLAPAQTAQPSTTGP